MVEMMAGYQLREKLTRRLRGGCGQTRVPDSGVTTRMRIGERRRLRL
jgi:hypothetical protein